MNEDMKRGLIAAALILAMGFCVSCSGRHNAFPSTVSSLAGASRPGAAAQSGAQSGTRPPERTLGEAVAEIRNYAPPKDVDKETFEALREKLIAEIEKRQNERTVLRSAHNPFGKVTDFRRAPDDTSLFPNLIWTYTNPGDYNFDGEVNSADLTEIARYFGQTGYSGDGYTTVQSWVDGDKSGYVDIGDITPLALNYLTRIVYYRVSWSEQPDGPYEEIERVWIRDVVLKPGSITERTSFSFDSYAYDGRHFFLSVAPFDYYGQVGAESEALPAIAMPYISSIDTNSGFAGENLTMSAYVQGPGTMTYEWNFGGAATPNTPTGNAPTVVLGEKGVYSGGMLTVTNEYGSDTRSFILSVHTRANPPADSIWIDTLDDKSTSDVYFDIYASGLSEPVYDVEVNLIYNEPITGSNGGVLINDTSLSPNPGFDFASGWGANLKAISKKQGAQIITITTSDIYPMLHSGLAGKIVWIGAMRCMDVNTAGRAPDEVKIYFYTGDIGNPDRVPFGNWSGDFGWKNASGSPGPWKGSGGPPQYPLMAEWLKPDASSGAGGVTLTWKSGLWGDYNGDFMVNMLDLAPVKYRYNQLTNDGVNDELDRQVDGDQDSIISIADITPIALYFYTEVTGYLIYRDGVNVGVVSVYPYGERTHLIEPYPSFAFTDITAPRGTHSYTIVPRDAESASNGIESLPTVVTVT